MLPGMLLLNFGNLKFSFSLASDILKNSQRFFSACRFKFYMIINYIKGKYIFVKRTNTHRKEIFILEWSIIYQCEYPRMETKFEQSCTKINKKILILNFMDSFYFFRYCETSENFDHILT